MRRFGQAGSDSRKRWAPQSLRKVYIGLLVGREASPLVGSLLLSFRLDGHLRFVDYFADRALDFTGGLLELAFVLQFLVVR